jgi:peptidyl-tRNA hydrolase ICT1
MLRYRSALVPLRRCLYGTRAGPGSSATSSSATSSSATSSSATSSTTTTTATPDDDQLRAARAWLAALTPDTLPLGAIGELSFSRSSGPGGQNVNK